MRRDADRADVYESEDASKRREVTLVSCRKEPSHAREEKFGQVARSARNVDVSIVRQLVTERSALRCVFGRS